MGNWNNLLDSMKIGVGVVSPGDLSYQIKNLGNASNTFNASDAPNVSTVYTCIEILSSTIARLPLNLNKESNKGTKVLRDDNLHYLLHYAPNEYTNAYNFWNAVDYWRNLRGNSFVRIIRDKKSAVESLHIVMPDDVIGYSIFANQLYYTYFQYKADGTRREKPTKINASEMLHFTFGSHDGIQGMDPITKLMLELNIKHKAGTTLDNLYSNNALNKALVLPAVSNESSRKQIADFNENTSLDSTGRLRQLPFGSQLVDMSLDLNAIQFVESMKFNITQIAALYRVPAWMLGILESTKFSSVEAMTTDFKVNTMSPIAKMYKREFESKLLTKEQVLNRITIEFNTNALVETDLTTKNNILADNVMKGLLTPNAAAKILGYEPWKDGGESHWMPSSNMFGELRHESEQMKNETARKALEPEEPTPGENPPGETNI
jgi:HK97 family phage portal protein